MSLDLVIKWNGNKFNVQADLDQPGLVLKTQIFTLTQVSPERQKIMVKGGVLKDDTDLKTLKLKEGQVLMMMGTVGELKEPQEKMQFVEDMTDAEVSKALKLPAGLVNLGNTCYLNSTIQCLRAVPELVTAITQSELARDPVSNFALSLKALFTELDTSGTSVQPIIFIQLLRQLFPQFGEQDRNGFMQQDAEECWGQLVHTLSEKVKGLAIDGSKDDSNFVDQFMTTEFLVQTTCDDAPSESPSVSYDATNKIRVAISTGGPSYLTTEIENSFTEKIEKTSPTTGKMAMYTKKSQISKLPRYLTVNFVRFQWKPTEQVKAKILKRVSFPFQLDMSPFCTLELQEKLAPARKQMKEYSDWVEEQKKIKQDAPPELVEKKVRTALDIDQIEIATKIGVNPELSTNPGVNMSGFYDLVGVLTHMGRGANSGHYIGWVKIKEVWWKFDDDKVTQVSEDDIKKLEGGGDWHTAYICLYRAKFLDEPK